MYPAQYPIAPNIINKYISAGSGNKRRGKHMEGNKTQWNMIVKSVEDLNLT